MKWGKSVLSLRQKNRAHAELAIREERRISGVLLPIFLPTYTAFSVVDWIASGYQRFLEYFLLRLLVVFTTLVIYNSFRGRLKYGMRYALIFVPYMFGIEYVMGREDLLFSPYFAGLAIVMFSSTAIFPMPGRIAIPMFLVSILPVAIMLALKLPTEPQQAMQGIAMLLGTIMVSIINSMRVREELLGRVSANQALASDLRNRNEEIRIKAQELVSRRRFESQFSPQIISKVLSNMSQLDSLTSQKICMMVCDIKNSTSKSASLSPDAYADVIQEVFDIFSACCLKWNVTIDKFTGDGAQAFAGSPESGPDDLYRIMKAGADIMSMLSARSDALALRWRGPVEIRIGICEGDALVGFLGKGALRSFTAIGQSVSLTHRVCAEAPVGHLLVVTSDSNEPQGVRSFSTFCRQILLQNLKGFEGSSFTAFDIRPSMNTEPQVNERCEKCATPMVVIESHPGLPRVVCPNCSMRNFENLEVVASDKSIKIPVAISSHHPEVDQNLQRSKILSFLKFRKRNGR